MKKLFTIAMLLLATMTMTAQSNQKILEEIERSYEGYRLIATLPEYSYNGEVQMYAYYNDYQIEHNPENVAGATHLVFYNNNFDKQREMEIPNIAYQLYRQNIYPEIIGYEIKIGREYSDTTEFNSSNYDFSYYDDSEGYVEISIPYGGWTIDLVTKLIKYRYYYNILKQETTNEGTFFYIRYEDYNSVDISMARNIKKSEGITNYPTEWFWLKNNGTLVRVERRYIIELIYGSNYEVGEKVEYDHNAQRGYFYISRKNYDVSTADDRGILLSQTLFNEDQKYEYIAPIITDGVREIHQSSSYEGGISRMFYEKHYGGAITGFKVMSEDGSTLNSVNFDGNFVARYYDDCNLTIINGKYYLLFSGYILDETNLTQKYARLIYAMDKNTNQIQKVAEHVGNVNVYPRVAERSEMITVELNGEDNNDLREIVITNAAGQTMIRVPVEKGQKSGTIPASQLSRGMNIVDAIDRKGHNASKVIVK